jgi:N-acetylmuramoyl-L-alanine amidase
VDKPKRRWFSGRLTDRFCNLRWNMKKWFFLLFAAAFLLCANAAWTSAKAPKTTEPVPKLFLDGLELNAATPPKLVNGWVLVPIRIVAENLGYKVGWDSANKQVTVQEGSTQILMTLGDTTALVNGRAVTMQTPPTLDSDTTLIPLRFVSETFGLQILWDNHDKAVFLYTVAANDAGEDKSPPGSEPDGGADSGAETDNDANANPGSDSETVQDSKTDEGSGKEESGNETSGNAEPENASSGKTESGNAENQAGNGGENSGVKPPAGGTQDNQGESGKEDGASGPLIPDPESEPARLSQIRYEPNALVLTYTGSLTPVVHYLSNPDRLVMDLIHAEFADEFSSGFSSGIVPDYFPKLTEAPSYGQIAEMKVNGDLLVTGIRFSRYSENPRTVRVVADLSQITQYELTHDDERGVIRLLLNRETSSAPAKDSYVVVLDAGHGGSDPGAKSISGKWEKDFNLSVVKKVKEILSKESKIKLVLTREGDTYPTLDDRINLANSLNADLFISVHGNSNNKSDVNGTETYYFRPESLALAELLHKHATAATGFKDNGVRTAEFKVVKYTVMPAALLEVGYLSNAANEKKMYEENFQQRVAEAIANTIKQYFKLS